MAVLASIEPAELQVDPGAEAWLAVRVRNRGTIVDRFDIAVVGPMAPWAYVDPPNLRLFPDQEGEARVGFRPPRASSPVADTYPFGIAVRAVSDPSDSTVEEGRIAVAPFVELAAEIVPQTSRGSRSGSHDLNVQNRGNSVAEVSVRASDPDRLLAIDVRPPLIGLKPADTGTIRTVVKPKDTFLMGSSKRIPFIVQIDEPSAGSQQVSATLEQRAIIPGWLKPAAGLVVAALAAVLVLPPLLFPEPIATAIPTEVVVSTDSPTQEPTQEVTDGPPETEGPSPTPTYGPPDLLVAAGDGAEATSEMGLTLICAQNDPCRDVVKDRILSILSNLQGRVVGARLVSFVQTPPGTLPVSVRWNDWRYPYSSVDGTKGETTEVSIDLAPALVGQQAYALVRDFSGTQFTFAIAGEDAERLREELYVIPVPVPTPPPDSGGIVTLTPIYDIPIGSLLLGDIYFFATPAP